MHDITSVPAPSSPASSPAAKPKAPGPWAILFGVILPGATVAIELVSRMCATTFFDPMPTWMMTLLVAAVPAANLLLIRRLQLERSASRWALRLFGGAIMVSFIFMLVMLPLYPISVVAIIFYGLGLLPFAPLFAMIITISGLNKLSARQEGVWKQARIGMALGAVLLLIADLPVSATRLAVDMASDSRKDDQSAVTLMRWLGNEDDLLRMSYGSSGNGGGLSSMLLLGNWTNNIWGEGVIDDTTTARQLYFRATGKAYNAEPAPRGAGSRGGMFGRGDQDQGGESVGGRLDTLDLASSRIDGSISVEDNLAYAEWTMEIANTDSAPGEARFTMALPEGAVASRATLWINGEPREASIAGRAETRAAYSRVVSRQRDPLLVTTTGSGRLLVQAFPVPAKGTMKFRVGYSAPLAIARDGSRSLALPAIVEENFDINADQKHAVWFEGFILNAQPGWKTVRLPKGAMKLQAEIADGRLRTERPRIVIPPIREASTRGATVAGISAVQTIAQQPAEKPSDLAILLDGSVTNEGAGEALAKALDAIAPGTPVRLSVAAEEPVSIPAAPWSATQRAKIEQAVDSVNFAGGVDNVPALTALLSGMNGPASTLLWIHGPQPTEFAMSNTKLSQFLDRSEAALPQLVRYQGAPGRAITLDRSAWFETARMVSPSGNAANDLKKLLADMTQPGQSWQVSRASSQAGGPGSPHIVRLWGGQQLAQGTPFEGADREKAISLANTLNIITPVSGAVVLETNEDYQRNGLPVPSADKVPSVPEPHEWALILMVLGFGLYALRRRLRICSGDQGLAFA